MKRALLVLVAALLCSCTAGSGGHEAAKPGHLRLLDRSDPLVEHTFQIMEVRAHFSEVRERLRAEGERVCEEGEHGTRWQQDCNICWCEWGARHCTRDDCSRVDPDDDDGPAERARGIIEERARFDDYRDYREQHRRLGRRFCEAEEIGTSWQWGCNTCWCEAGYRVCSKAGCPPP